MTRVKVPWGFIGTLLGLLWTFESIAIPQAQAEVDLESSVETAFIYQFTRYIDWPKPADAGASFRIMVFDRDPLTQNLEEMAKVRTVQGRKIEIVVAALASTADFCGKTEIAVFNHLATDRVLPVLRKLKGCPILTLGNEPGLGQKGVMINFYREGDRLRFEINRGHLEAEGLKASAQLLKLARIIE